MKVRTGFVSNSSSSSFVVRVKDILDCRVGYTRVISKEQEEFLLNHGFAYTHANIPERIEFYDDNISHRGHAGWKADEKTDNLGFHIGVNQDFVLRFLLKNKIPFSASVHYGHETILYKPAWESFLQIQNVGVNYAMYDFLRKCDDSDIIRLSNDPTFKWVYIGTYLEETAYLEEDDYDPLRGGFR